MADSSHAADGTASIKAQDAMAHRRSILAGMERASAWSRASWGPLARWQWLSLIGLALFLYTFRLGVARTLTDHEAYVAGPARQMVTTGEWLVPRLGHVLWLEKPPRAQWRAGLSASAAGRFDEATVRLPSALAGVGVVLLLAWIVAHLFEATVGYVAGLLMATSVFMLQTARQAVADMHLACLVLAAIAVFVDLHFRGGPRARWRVWLFWLLLGLMNLSKGRGPCSAPPWCSSRAADGSPCGATTPACGGLLRPSAWCWRWPLALRGP
jgi:hypothetical protein